MTDRLPTEPVAPGRGASSGIGLVEGTARFVRLFSLGATIAYPLVGLATASADRIDATSWLRLVMFACLFHVLADVGNDVCDLPIDRTDPRRATSPLVRGLIAPPVAVAIAVAALPGMALVLWGGGGHVAVPLAAAVGFIVAYDVVGKSLPIPIVADVVQGVGWACLVHVGAAVGGGATPATNWAAAFVVCYIAMVNGVHGAVRDVETDRRAGATTTAVLLGARIADDGVVLPPMLVTHAVVLQVLLGVTLAGTARAAAMRGQVSAVAVVIACLVFAGSTWQLVAAFRRRRDLGAAMAAGTWHLFLAPSCLLLASFRPGSWLPLATIMAFVAPPLVYGLIVRGTEPFPPSRAVPMVETVDVSVRTRLAGLVEMTRIGVPATASMLVLTGSVIGGRAPPMPLFAGMLAAGLAAAGANVHNDRCDLVADRINRPDRALPSGRVSPDLADKFVLASVSAAFATSAVLGLPAMILTGILATAGLLYSVVLRRRGVAGQIAVSIILASPVAYGGAVVAGRLVARHGIAAFLVAAMVFSRETLKVIPDREGDRAAGCHTLATDHDDPTVLAVFRVSACVLMVGSLAVLWAVPTVVYLASAVGCIVVPTTMAMVRVRGTPDQAQIDLATARFGRVFALGLVPLFVLGVS